MIAHGRISTIESTTATPTNTIYLEDLYRAHFDNFVASEASEVCSRKDQHLFDCVFRFRSGPIYTRNYGHRCEIGLFF